MPDKYTLTALLLVCGSIAYFLGKGFLVNTHQLHAGEPMGEDKVVARADTIQCRYLTYRGLEDRLYWNIPTGDVTGIRCPLFMRH